MQRNERNDHIIRVMFNGALLSAALLSLSVVIGNTVDNIVIGRFLGADELAASMLVRPMILILGSIGSVAASGTQLRMSAVMAKGDRSQAHSVFSTMVAMAVLTGCILTALIYPAAPAICRFFGMTGENASLLEHGTAYLRGYIVALPVASVNAILLSLMQLDGDRKRGIRATLVSLAVNIAGDLLCIFLFGGSLFGIALATSISTLSSLAVLLFHFRPGKTSYLKFDPERVCLPVTKQILALGAPDLISTGAVIVKSVVLNTVLMIVASKAEVAAASIMVSVTMLFCSLIVGLWAANATTMGVLSGEKDLHAMKLLSRYAGKTACVLAAVLMGILLIFADTLAALFISESKQITEQAAEGIRFFALSIPAQTALGIIASNFQGMRRTRLSGWILLIKDVLVSPAFLVIMGLLYQVTGVWSGYLVGYSICLIGIILFLFAKNRKISLYAEDVLLLSDSMPNGEEACFEATVADVIQAVEISESLRRFCLQHGAEYKTAHHIALAVEEMACNVIRHGFNGDSNSIDIRVVAENDGGWVLRIRDDCPLFDPTLWHAKQTEEQDPTGFRGIGIKMVMQLSKKVEYMPILQLNCLLIRL